MWTIYLIDVLSNFGFVLLSVLILALCVLVSSAIPASDGNEEALSLLKRSACVSFVSALFLVVIPSKQTMYLMAGANAVETIAQTPEAKEFGTKVLTIVNNKLDDLAKEKK